MELDEWTLFLLIISNLSIISKIKQDEKREVWEAFQKGFTVYKTCRKTQKSVAFGM